MKRRCLVDVTLFVIVAVFFGMASGALPALSQPTASAGFEPFKSCAHVIPRPATLGNRGCGTTPTVGDRTGPFNPWGCWSVANKCPGLLIVFPFVAHTRGGGC